MNKFVRFLTIVGKVFVKAWYPMKIIGPRKFEVKKSIFVGNHVSGWDPVLLYAWTKTPISFMYKAEMRKSAFLRWVFDGLDFVPVHRGEVDINATKMSLKLLKNEKILGLFPEGTRNPDIDCLLPLKTGAALFAIKTKAPMRAFYTWDKAKAFHKNYCMIGDEFTLEEFYDKPITKELLAEATEKIRRELDGLRIKLNAMMEEKGVKHRKRSQKELKRLAEYNEKQRLKEEQAASAGNTDTHDEILH